MAMIRGEVDLKSEQTIKPHRRVESYLNLASGSLVSASPH
jgi:hypothetical protein